MHDAKIARALDRVGAAGFLFGNPTDGRAKETMNSYRIPFPLVAVAILALAPSPGWAADTDFVPNVLKANRSDLHVIYGSSAIYRDRTLSRYRRSTLTVFFNRFTHEAKPQFADVHYGQNAAPQLKLIVPTEPQNLNGAQTKLVQIVDLANVLKADARLDRPEAFDSKARLNDVLAQVKKFVTSASLDDEIKRLETSRADLKSLTDKDERAKAEAKLEEQEAELLDALVETLRNTVRDELARAQSVAHALIDQEARDLAVKAATELGDKAADAVGTIETILKGKHLYDTYAFIPTGDDVQVSVTFSKLGKVEDAAGEKTTATPEPGGPTDLVPVDFVSLLRMKPSFSVGLLASDLRNDEVRYEPGPNSTFILRRGVKDDTTLKPVALIHLSLYKRGDFLTGPSLGVTFDKDGNTGYFAGWSAQFGKGDRLAFNLGWEFAKVDRLNGVDFGDTLLSKDDVTRSMMRHRLVFGLTYAFNIGGKSNAAKAAEEPKTDDKAKEKKS